jgi:excisionase family DNA binding protein
MKPSTVAKMEVEPILCSVSQGCQMLGIGIQAVYDLLGAGLIKAVKHGTRTLIVVESLHEYVAKLQLESPARVAPPRRRKPKREREQLETSTIA